MPHFVIDCSEDILNNIDIKTVLTNIKTSFKKYIFCPSRIKTNDSSFMIDTGQWKNNSLLLEAFKVFRDNKGSDDIGLVFIDKQGEGENVEQKEFKELISNYGLDNDVIWLTPQNPGGFTRYQLVSLYQECFAVADDFGVGWFGSIALEGLATGRPVFNFVDESAMSILYPWHPIISSNNAQRIAVEIEYLVSNEQAYKELCERSRGWIEEFHSISSAKQKYSENFRQIG